MYLVQLTVLLKLGLIKPQPEWISFRFFQDHQSSKKFRWLLPSLEPMPWQQFFHSIFVVMFICTLCICHYFLQTLFLIIKFMYCVYIFAWVHVCATHTLMHTYIGTFHETHVYLRGQLSGVRSLFPTCRSWGLNLSCCSW